MLKTASSSGGSNGTVTNIATGTGLTGGPITTTGTISLANTAVTAASYGSASNAVTITIDAQGRITSAANTAIAIANSSVSGLGTMSIQNASNVNITGGFVTGNLTSSNVSITGGTMNVQTTNLTAATNVSATFANSSIMLVPAGYINFDLNGTVVKVPYYAV
jgi:hypothetical protein